MLKPLNFRVWTQLLVSCNRVNVLGNVAIGNKEIIFDEGH